MRRVARRFLRERAPQMPGKSIERSPEVDTLLVTMRIIIIIRARFLFHLKVFKAD